MITLNNKEYKFKFGFKAMLNFENETGQSVTNLTTDFKMQTVVDMCYYGIIAAGETITKDEVVNAIDSDPSLIKLIPEVLSKDLAAMNLIEEEAKK